MTARRLALLLPAVLAAACSDGPGPAAGTAPQHRWVTPEGGVFLCSELSGMAGIDPGPNGLDAAPIVQGCIDETPAGGELHLPPGRYVLNRDVVIRKPLTLRTRGTTAASPACAPGGDPTCAELAPNPHAYRPELLPTDDTGTKAGFLQIRSDHVTVDRIVLDGNRAGLLARGGWTPELCGLKNQRGVLVTGAHVTLTRSVVKSFLCNAGLHVLAEAKSLDGHHFTPETAPTHHITVVGNHFVANGASRFDSGFFFADGIVAFETPFSTYAFNTCLDNTDVQIIIGGCTACQIHDNLLGHSSDTYGNGASFTPRSHGALMIHAWPREIRPDQYWSLIPTSGDFTGARIFHNWIDCQGRCGVGAMFGGNQWYPPIALDRPETRALTGCHADQDPGSTDPEHCSHYFMATRGGEFVDNTVQGAAIGLVVDDAIGLSVHDNHALPHNGSAPGFSLKKSPFFAWNLNCERFTALPAAIVSPFSATHNDIRIGFWPRIETTVGCIPDYVPAATAPASPPPIAFYSPRQGLRPGWARWNQLPPGGHADPGTLINIAYETCLGHQPDAAAGSYWWNRYMSGVAPAQLWTEICQSDEFRWRVIGTAYRICLGREADSAGASAWMYSFGQGATPEQVWDAICRG